MGCQAEEVELEIEMERAGGSISADGSKKIFAAIESRVLADTSNELGQVKQKTDHGGVHQFSAMSLEPPLLIKLTLHPRPFIRCVNPCLTLSVKMKKINGMEMIWLSMK